MAQDHINSAEAAKMCGVDRATFNRWAAKGLVPIVLTAPSGERIYSRAAVATWAKSRPTKVSAA